MKNKKGFTLVELLAVITILGFLMILLLPNVRNSFLNMKNQTEKINREHLIDAGKTLGTDIFICDVCHEQYNLKGDLIISCEGHKDILQMVSALTGEANMNCAKARNLLKDGIRVSVLYLKDNDYFSDRANNCEENGEMTIKEVNSNIIVTLDDNIKCNKRGS